jgi:hypothetical protein
MQETLKYIEDHPQEWDQGVWASRTPCGTACCFAGWAVALHEQGNPEDLFDFIQNGDDVSCLRDDVESPYAGRDIERAAKDCLNIEEEWADALFDGTNSLSDLQVIVARLCAGLGAGDDEA